MYDTRKNTRNLKLQYVIRIKIPKEESVLLKNNKPDLEEPAANDFNLCKTVNCMAVYGITMRSAGTLPRQNPYEKKTTAEYKYLKVINNSAII